jgi:NAD(P)-dependent dehydrogenase (short-subunit alcohol dehydrogenase family)
MTRTYVVTGAGSGIGQATTEHLRNQGHTVIGVDIKNADVLADLSTADGRTAMVREVEEQSGGKLDGIIAVAGLSAASPVTVAVNYFGAKATLEGLRPLLVDSDAPRAVVVASFAVVQDPEESLYKLLLADDEPGAKAETERLGDSKSAMGGSAAYIASKKAIAQWVRLHATDPEWAGAGIALNVVAPGITSTPMTAEVLQTAEGRAALEAELPSPLNGPAAPPAAPAALLAWLTSAENTHVTGQIIFVDGGAESMRRPEFL